MRHATPHLVLLAALAAAPAPAAAQEDPTELLTAGGRALVEGDLEEAERRFEAVRQADPALPAAWLGLAEVRERQGRIEEALPLARRARELAPQTAVVHRALGRLLARKGEDEAALEALAEARRLAPEAPESHLLAALLLRRGGRLAEAAALLAGAIEVGADSADLRREQILLLLADRRPAEAVAAAEAAVERFPGAGGLQLGLGLALAALPERRAEAPGWLESALASGVERPERVRFELGTVLLRTGDAAAAREQLELAAAAMPAEPAVWHRLAQARRATGDDDGEAAAMARFRELRQTTETAGPIDPGDPRVGAALDATEALAAADRLPEALARVRRLLAEVPGLPPALALEARILYSLGRPDEALAGIRAAVAADPETADYPYLEGRFQAGLRRPAEAAAAFRRALELEPGLAAAWEQLGRLALAGGRPEEAASRFAKALELGGEGEALRLFYADALERIGRLEESRRQMEAYRRLHEGGGEPEP